MAACSMTLTPYVEEWLARADEDLHAVTIMLDEGSLPNSVCFHAQRIRGFVVERIGHTSSL